MTMSDSSEKRRYQRLDGTYFFSYKVEGSKEGYDMSRTKNISRGGILLTVNRIFEKGVKLDLIIRGPFALEPLKIKAEVLGYGEISSGFYEIRIQFVHPDIASLEKLDDFIQRRSGSD